VPNDIQNGYVTYAHQKCYRLSGLAHMHSNTYIVYHPPSVMSEKSVNSTLMLAYYMNEWHATSRVTLHSSTISFIPSSCMYVGYSESKYRLCISLAHPKDCHFAHVQ